MTRRQVRFYHLNEKIKGSAEKYPVQNSSDAKTEYSFNFSYGFISGPQLEIFHLYGGCLLILYDPGFTPAIIRPRVSASVLLGSSIIPTIEPLYMTASLSDMDMSS